MSDVHLDDRVLRLLLGLIEDFLTDDEYVLTESEWSAYRVACKAIGRTPATPFKQQSLGFLAEDEPPHPDEPPSHGIMADYMDRFRGAFRSGQQWTPPPPKPDPAKAIADKMARASHDAATGKSTPTPPPKATEKRALTDEEKAELRRALGEE